MRAAEASAWRNVYPLTGLCQRALLRHALMTAMVTPCMTCKTVVIVCMACMRTRTPCSSQPTVTSGKLGSLRARAGLHTSLIPQHIHNTLHIHYPEISVQLRQSGWSNHIFQSSTGGDIWDIVSLREMNPTSGLPPALVGILLPAATRKTDTILAHPHRRGRPNTRQQPAFSFPRSVSTTTFAPWCVSAPHIIITPGHPRSPVPGTSSRPSSNRRRPQ